MKKPLYIGRTVTNELEIRDFYNKHGIEICKNLHVTICYSKTPITCPKLDDDIKIITPYEGNYVYKTFGTDAMVKVLTFYNADLATRHKWLVDVQGASFDFPTFTPHITLMYLDHTDLPMYNGPIILSSEYAEDLDEEWCSE